MSDNKGHRFLEALTGGHEVNPMTPEELLRAKEVYDAETSKLHSARIQRAAQKDVGREQLEIIPTEHEMA